MSIWAFNNNDRTRSLKPVFYWSTRRTANSLQQQRPHEVTETSADEDTRIGRISLTDAAAYSVNTAFAGLVAQLGACSVRDLMTAMGLHQGNGKPIEGYPAPVTLGANPTSPLTLASAYATVASGGTYCVPSPVLSITTSDKKTIALPKNQCTKVLEPDVANGVTKILKTVLTKGTGAGNSLDGGRPAAGKTGTAQNRQYDRQPHSWFVGFAPYDTSATPRYAFACVVENGGYGKTVAAVICRDALRRIATRQKTP